MVRTAAQVCAFGLVATAVGAAAEDSRGVWYVLPSYHQAGVEKANMHLKQGTTDIKFDSTFGDDTGPGFAIGYAFDAPYRVDLEYQQQSNDLKVPGSNPLNGESLNSTMVAVSGWRDFASWHGLRAYVGAGIGGGKLEVSNLDTNVAIGRLGAGAVWYFRHDMGVDVGYRFQFTTSNPELSGNSQKLETDFSGQSVQLGFRYDF